MNGTAAVEWLRELFIELVKFAYDTKMLMGLLIGGLVMSMYWAPYVNNEECEPQYPMITLWRDRAWAFFEVRIWHRHLYGWWENEKEAVADIVKKEAIEAIAPGASVTAPPSSLLGLFTLYILARRRNA